MTVPVLAYADTNKSYIPYTDASDDCIGVCLCQEQDIQEMKSKEPNKKGIRYLSHKLTTSQKN